MGPDALEDWEGDELLDWTTSLNFDEQVEMGPDALEDWEVDALLDWTTSLNFDE